MGYKDGARFMVNQEDQDPEKAQMQQALQQYEQIIQQLQQQVADKEGDRKVKVMQIQQQGSDNQADREVGLVETRLKEAGEDRRLQAELAASLIEKRMDVNAASRRSDSA